MLPIGGYLIGVHVNGKNFWRWMLVRVRLRRRSIVINDSKTCVFTSTTRVQNPEKPTPVIQERVYCVNDSLMWTAAVLHDTVLGGFRGIGNSIRAAVRLGLILSGLGTRPRLILELSLLFATAGVHCKRSPIGKRLDCREQVVVSVLKFHGTERERRCPSAAGGTSARPSITVGHDEHCCATTTDHLQSGDRVECHESGPAMWLAVLILSKGWRPSTR